MFSLVVTPFHAPQQHLKTFSSLPILGTVAVSYDLVSYCTLDFPLVTNAESLQLYMMSAQFLSPFLSPVVFLVLSCKSYLCSLCIQLKINQPTHPPLPSSLFCLCLCCRSFETMTESKVTKVYPSILCKFYDFGSYI